MAKECVSGANKMDISHEVVIEINRMHKWYGQFHVLKEINLKVCKGERIVICGPLDRENRP